MTPSAEGEESGREKQFYCLKNSMAGLKYHIFLYSFMHFVQTGIVSPSTEMEPSLVNSLQNSLV